MELLADRQSSPPNAVNSQSYQTKGYSLPPQHTPLSRHTSSPPYQASKTLSFMNRHSHESGHNKHTKHTEISFIPDESI